MTSRVLLAAVALMAASAPAMADCRAHNVNSFWLVELAGEVSESVTIVATFDSSPECVAASVSHTLSDGAFFAACLPLTECGEAEHAEYMAHEYGLIEGDF